MHRSHLLIWSLLVTWLSFPLLLVCQQSPTTLKRVPTIFEDEYVRIPIPDGWSIVQDGGDEPELGRLVLRKNGFRLSIAYHTSHASGVIGGRFIEAFTIPWLDTDQAWGCSGAFASVPQPANLALMFINLYLQTDLASTRERCGIEKALTAHESAERWFGGYFTTREGEWFFESQDGCCCNELKSYTLTADAQLPTQLPSRGDPALARVIRQAIAIVNSIHYKKFPPTLIPYDPWSWPWQQHVLGLLDRGRHDRRSCPDTGLAGNGRIDLSA